MPVPVPAPGLLPQAQTQDGAEEALPGQRRGLGPEPVEPVGCRRSNALARAMGPEAPDRRHRDALAREAMKPVGMPDLATLEAPRV